MAIPLIYLTFANDGQSNLPQLSKELNDIEQKIKYLDAGGFLRLDKLTDANSDNLFEYLAQFLSKESTFELNIFHFAGHAGGKKLLLDDGILHTDGLAQFLGEAKKSLKLVFLNGCSTAAQVKALHKAGIPAVIATERPIEDEKAASFALFFYEAFIKNSHSLEGAFNLAAGKLQAQFNKEMQPHEFPQIHRDLEIEEDAPVFAWGLYIHSQKTGILQSYFRRSIPSNISYMPIKIEKEVNMGVERIIAALEKNGAEVNKKNDGTKKRSMVIAFSWIIGEPLRKLFIEDKKFNSHIHSKNRLHLLLDAYNATTRFLAFILLNQVTEEKGKGKLKGISLVHLINLRKDNFRILNFLEIQKECWKELKENNIAPFIRELPQTLMDLEENENVQKMFEFVETVRNRLNNKEIEEIEGAELSRKCEAILSELLIRNAFLAQYRLLTIKDINITRYRFRQPTFAHITGELHDLYVDNLDDIQNIAALENYAYSHSVVLIKKGYENQLYEPENYLILSPLIIDRSAYDIDKSTPEIYYLAWKTESCYTYANIKCDSIDPKESYFIDIEANNADEARNVIFEQMQTFNA